MQVQKRKCGNCRFFENNNMAGSGWCRHPQRVELSNLVMVRKNELNCRNTWDQDLWEDARSIKTPAAVVNPALAVQPAAFVPPEGATDRVMEESVPVVKAGAKSATLQSSKHFWRLEELDDQDTSAGLPWLVEESKKLDVEESTELGEEPLDDLPQARRSGREAEPAHPGLRPLIDMPTSPPPAPIFPSDDDACAAPAQPEPAVSPAASAASTPVTPARQNNIQPTEPLPDLRAGAPAEQAQPGPAHSAQTFTFVPFTSEPQTQSVNQHDGPIPLLPIREKPFSFSNEGAASPTTLDGEPLKRVAKLAGVQRCCGNCRDFKRNSDGTSGICTSAYAFPEGAVVKSHELACGGTSIGSWWLPSDDLFLNAADTSHHSRPTPHLDKALGKQQHAGSTAGRVSRRW